MPHPLPQYKQAPSKLPISNLPLHIKVTAVPLHAVQAVVVDVGEDAEPRHQNSEHKHHNSQLNNCFTNNTNHQTLTVSQ